MPTTDSRAIQRRPAVAIVTAAVLAMAAWTAGPAGATEAQQGLALLRSVESGKLACSSLTAADANRVGEYAMERMLGSATAHAAMDRQITAMAGSAGERQAHVFMGQRFAGCATGRPPVAFGSMMGTMGASMMSSAYGGGSSSMGSGARGGGGAMGGSGVAMNGLGVTQPTGTRAGGWSSADTVMVGLMGVLAASALGALVFWRTERRRGHAPLPS